MIAHSNTTGTALPKKAFFYLLAWVPYAIAIAIFFAVWNGDSLWHTLVPGLRNALQAAVLGLGIVWFSRRLRWHGTPRLVFFAAHLAGAAVYGLLRMAASMALASWASSADDPVALQWRLVVWEALIGVLIYACVASICYVLQFASRIEQEKTRAAQAEALRAQAELAALRARLHPHFLFNTLHSLLALIRSDPRAAEQGMERFGDLLRYALRVQDERGDRVRLEDELRFVRDYIALEALRLGDRLRVREEIDPDALDGLVPSFCLQTLVENAVRHAAAARTTGAIITLRAGYDGERLVLRVEDDGPGATVDAMAAATGVGLRVLRERLQAWSGGGALEVRTAPDRGFSARVELALQAATPLVEAAS